MFKISISRDVFGKNPKKFKGIAITHGYYCIKAYKCSNGRECKYRKNFAFHNFSVGLHRFFEHRLHIKLPHLLYIHRHSVDLSGTTKCPFGKPRAYSCYDCAHCGGVLLRDCLNPKKKDMTVEQLMETTKIEDKDWPTGRCTLFEKTSWADNWDKDTGEMK